LLVAALTPAQALAATTAAAADNATLWQQQPAVASSKFDATLADGARWQVSLEGGPVLQWRNIGEARGLRVGGAAVGSVYRLKETLRHGFVLRVDALRLQYIGVDDSTNPSASLKVAQIGVRAADVEWRIYPINALTPFFVGGTLGVYGGAVQFEKVAGRKATTQVWPLSAAAGVGWGRLLPINPRVALAHLERVLRQDGVMTASIDEPVRREIMALWMEQANALGVNSRAIGTMAILAKTPGFVGPLGALTAYRLERVLETWLAAPAMARWQGKQTWALVRANLVLPGRDARYVGASVELRQRWVHNISLTQDAWFEPAFAWTPRIASQAVQPYLGQPYATLLDASAPEDLIGPQRVRLDLPVRYSRVFLDPDENLQGILSVGANTALGYTRALYGMAGTTAAYTCFFSGVRGVKVAFGAAAGRTASGFDARVDLQVAYVDGTGSTFYVAPSYPDGGMSALALGRWP
jgi:hypothetical protein